MHEEPSREPAEPRFPSDHECRDGCGHEAHAGHAVALRVRRAPVEGSPNRLENDTAAEGVRHEDDFGRQRLGCVHTTQVLAPSAAPTSRAFSTCNA